MEDIDDETEKLTIAKSDEELENYLLKPKKFHPLEIAFAWRELQDRGKIYSEKEKAKVIAIIRKKVQAMYPHYYNTDSIICLSMLGTPLGGSILLALNLKSWRQRLEVISFGIFSAIGLCIADPPKGIRFILIYNLIGAFILDTYFWNKYMVISKNSYEKSIMPPMIIAIVIVLTLGILNFNQWRLDALTALKNVIMPYIERF